jgi:Ycf66 protein N-terminus
VGFTSPAPILFGLILIMAALALFLTSKFKPELHQESDNIYVVLGVICGLLLIISLDLSFAMSFQQLLMIGALISITWQYLQVRAENKKLKGGGGRASGREREAPPARRSTYSARLDDEPEYPTSNRGGRRFAEERADRQFSASSSYEEDYPMPERRAGRMLPDYDRSDRRETNSFREESRQRNDYSTPSYDAPSYEERSYDRYVAPAANDDWSDSTRSGSNGNNDWEDRPERSRRRSSGSSDAGGRSAQGRRRSSLTDSGDEPAAKSSAYVDYEPVEPETSV